MLDMLDILYNNINILLHVRHHIHRFIRFMGRWDHCEAKHGLGDQSLMGLG